MPWRSAATEGRLVDLCGQEKCTLALKSILGGVNGNGFFKRSILDTFYNKTEGNRPQISGLATRLLQLSYGGMMVISTYEAMVRGRKASEYVAKNFDRQLNETSDKVQFVLDKCVENFRENMLKDLNRILDEGGSNMELVAKISNFMSNKYDWLENFCLVYNDMTGYDKHTINGDRVESLHRNEKCGIVFYRKKSESPQFSNRYDEVNNIMEELLCGRRVIVCRRPIPFGYAPAACGLALLCYERIVAKVEARGIGWTGCAVIRRLSDLSFHGNFSTKIAYVDEGKSTIIFLLK